MPTSHTNKELTNMRIDYIQINLNDLSEACLKIKELTEAEAGAVIMEACIDFINVNKNSKYKFVRDTLKNTLQNEGGGFENEN